MERLQEKRQQALHAKSRGLGTGDARVVRVVRPGRRSDSTESGSLQDAFFGRGTVSAVVFLGHAWGQSCVCGNVCVCQEVSRKSCADSFGDSVQGRESRERFCLGGRVPRKNARNLKMKNYLGFPNDVSDVSIRWASMLRNDDAIRSWIPRPGPCGKLCAVVGPCSLVETSTGIVDEHGAAPFRIKQKQRVEDGHRLRLFPRGCAPATDIEGSLRCRSTTRRVFGACLES